MITKEELHKLIDECDIVRLNSTNMTVYDEGDHIEIYIETIIDFLKYCKTKSPIDKLDQMYNIFVGEFMSSENDHLLAKELYQKIQVKYNYSDEDIEWYRTEFKKRQNHED